MSAKCTNIEQDQLATEFFPQKMDGAKKSNVLPLAHMFYVTPADSWKVLRPSSQNYCRVKSRGCPPVYAPVNVNPHPRPHPEEVWGIVRD